MARSWSREVFVVVAGILVAFAIDAAWNASSLRRAQTDLAADLRADLRAADDRISRHLETKRALADASLRIIQAGLAGGQSVPADSVRTFGDRAISWVTLDLRHGTLGAVLAGVATVNPPSAAVRADLYALGVELAAAEENERRILDWIRSEIYTLVPESGGSALERIVAPEQVALGDLTYLQTPTARNALAGRVVLEREAIADLEALQRRIASLIQGL